MCCTVYNVCLCVCLSACMYVCMHCIQACMVHVCMLTMCIRTYVNYIYTCIHVCWRCVYMPTYIVVTSVTINNYYSEDCWCQRLLIILEVAEVIQECWGVLSTLPPQGWLNNELYHEMIITAPSSVSSLYSIPCLADL